MDLFLEDRLDFKFLRKILFTSSLLLTVGAQAASSSDCCNQNCFSFRVGAHALYLKPCSPNFISGYSQTTTGVPGPDASTTQSYFSVNPDYEWGFRIFGEIADPCDRATLYFSWTYFHSSDTVEVQNLNSPPTVNNSVSLENGILTAISSLDTTTKFRYHNVRLRGSYLCWSVCKLGVRGYVGGRYVFIRRTDRSEGTALNPVGLQITNQQIARMSAGGIDAGLQLYYPVCGSLYLRGEGGIGAFVGNDRLSITANTQLGSFQTSLGNNKKCFAGLDAQVAVGFETRCFNFNVRLEIGYQTEFYFHPIRTAEPYTAGTGEGFSTLFRDINIGFNGFFFGGSLEF